MGVPRAFQQPLIKTVRHLPDLVLKSIDHRLYGNRLCFFPGAKKGEFVILIPGSRQLDHTGRSCDLGANGGLTGEGRADHSGSSILVMEKGLAGLIGAGGRQMARCKDRIGLSQQQQAKEEGIDADIQERTSSQPEIIQSSLGIEGGQEAEVGPDIFYRSQLMVPDQLQGLIDHRQEAAPHDNHTELFCLNSLSVGGEVFRSADVVWTHAGDSIESMILFPKLSEDNASEQLDKIMQYYISRPPSGVGCWSLDPTQPKDLGVRLLARGFQPGWLPRWMAVDLEELQSDHPVPKELRVVPDNTSAIDKIKGLPYGDTELKVFSQQPANSAATLQRFIALLDRKVVAHCSVLLTKGAWVAAGIYHVGVIPRMRNQGIGKAVVGAACLHAKRNGYRYALLNGTGERMYEQLGFKKLGYGFTWWLKTSRLIAHPPAKTEVNFAEAIGRGDVMALEMLGANLDMNDLKAPLTNGMSLLQLAVYCHQPVSAEWLISRGLHVNVLEAWDLGWKDHAASILAEHPGQANQQYGEWDLTLLHMAADRNDPEMAKLALSAKPDLGIKDKIYQSTALDWARHLKTDAIIGLIEKYMEGLR